MTKKFLHKSVSVLLLVGIAYFGSIGVKETIGFRHQTAVGRGDSRLQTADDRIPVVCHLPTADFPAVFINGPVVSDVGELCVFRLSDSTIRADWTVIRQTDQELQAVFYIDTSGAALTFSSSLPAKYTIVAAVVEEGIPKILRHVCQYGLTPTPTPGPNPGPTPPLPPIPPMTLGEWVHQNVPDIGRTDCAVLASIYEATADAIDKGTIRSQAAAYSSIRTNTQAKIKPETWKKFLDELAVQIELYLDGATEIKPLSLLLREIVDALKSSGKVQTGPEVPASTEKVCPDPSGQACQVPATIRRIP
ncbi:MAG: hypothetical protein FWC43_04055 [Planctomycetaceae bacterium]|nr:hypothetical protein [Planctomycetaceae bacterium]